MGASGTMGAWEVRDKEQAQHGPITAKWAMSEQDGSGRYGCLWDGERVQKGEIRQEEEEQRSQRERLRPNFTREKEAGEKGSSTGPFLYVSC